MKRWLVLALALACTPATTPPTATPAVAVASPAPTARPTASPTPTTSPSPTLAPASGPATSTHGSITVEEPLGFKRIVSPVTVTGTASVFEAALLWSITTPDGRELTKGSTQASAGAPARGRFSFSATFNVSADAYGYVVVFNLSPRDGRVEDAVRVPVILAAR